MHVLIEIVIKCRDPAPREYLSTIIRFLKQISFYSTEEDVIQRYLDVVDRLFINSRKCFVPYLHQRCQEA